MMSSLARNARIPEQPYLFDSLDSKIPSSSRKAHIRRLVDVLQLSIQRNDWPRAKRSWCILARCKEFEWKKMWKTGLLLTGSGPDVLRSSSGHGDAQRLEYLRVLMLQSPENRVSILQEIILRLITENRHQDALDELELYIPSFPYQDSPVLHIYAGLLCLFLSQTSGTDHATGDLQVKSVMVGRAQPLDQGRMRECKSHFHRALDLDDGNIVASGFLERINASSSDRNTESESEEPSDMEITIGGKLEDTRPSKKKRDEGQNSP